MNVERVSGSAYARIASGDSIYEGWGANQGFITTKDGVVVVDTGFTAGTAKGLVREVRKRSSAQVRLVVNTHDHSDHVFGNSIFAEFSPVILSHANCRSRLVELGRERMNGYRRFDARLKSSMSGLTICPPQVTFEEGAELTLGRVALRLIHPKNGAHTSGDTMVLLPDEKVLFAGDVMWVGYHPNLEDADIQAWLQALERMSKMGVDLIVPGHGRVAEKSCIAPLARYLRQFDSRFRKLVRDGVPRKRVAEELEIAGTDDWCLKMIVKRNVDILYDRYCALERSS